MRRVRLVVLDDYEGELARSPCMERLRQLAEVRVLNRRLEGEDFRALKHVEIILALRERTQLDARFFEELPALELVIQTGGHAYHVDQNAATRAGVVVALGRRATRPMIAVPELALGLILGLRRQIFTLDSAMKRGDWPQAMGDTLAGSTLGVLGYGRHGRAVAKLAEAIGMKVIAWERAPKTGREDDGVARCGLDELLASSDVVSVHLRMSSESRSLLNRERLRKMKPSGILVNTARGEIIDESALVEALREGSIGGAGLDVFSVEPLPESSELRRLPNVLMTPHIGWKVREVLWEFAQIASQQLEDWLKHCLSAREVLNPDALAVVRPRSGGVQDQPKGL